ncbi:MAG: hypothetical protein J5819_10120 [Eubacterium sp.]|nr:hypothetical protein [Eubacterium sp.]
MIALQVENTKEFLKLLLEGSELDSFLVGHCEVTTFVTFGTDGHRRYVTTEDEDATEEEGPDNGESQPEHSERVSWRELRPTVVEMIRSSAVPGSLELDLFKYRARDMGSIRITFEDGKFVVTTGYMQKEFTLDRRGSEDWDDTCQSFLARNGIVLTAL